LIVSLIVCENSRKKSNKTATIVGEGLWQRFHPAESRDFWTARALSRALDLTGGWFHPPRSQSIFASA
jgi:hypothetical protein